jgi:hypothetical protein
MDFKPFEDQEEVDTIKKERDNLIEMLKKYDLPKDEKRFVLRRIQIISQRLLEKARYAKKN